MTRLDADVVELHTRMLNDRGRTSRFIRAVEEVVRPGDVVVDLGTGTGILAMAAARAGAKRVYAIEAGPIAGVAKQLFAANGFGRRITLLDQHSTEVELPTRADVLITETFGHGALSEQVLEAVVDARRRLLKRNARTVPGSLRIFGIPVSMPEETRGEYVFTPAGLEQWKAWYGIDFGALGATNRDALLTHWLDASHARRWPSLAEPALLAEIDLAALDDAAVHGQADVTAREEGTLSGLVLYFDLALSPSVSHSTDPRHAAPDNHWLNPVYLFVEPMELRRGETVRISYRYDPADKEEWIDVHPSP
ncbi:MAG TPA: 50S ribosomal protein L11 methyltransferase [Longimicrobiaceae bacterium]|nr:50S ribosomal protein L11 methyltransferase [Longimicrobiaceae bacterium]